jgi:hypothetical protein
MDGDSMSTLSDLRDVLASIYSEVGNLSISSDGEVIGNLSISSDGEVRRRISALVIEGRELIGELEAEDEVKECRCEHE